jgi:prepilin-type N-terminal cleavage/methylation domain-containing protein
MRAHRSLHRAQGFSLLETMIAMVVLAVTVVGVAGLFGLAVGTNKTQGEVATRTIEYAEDKMEQLQALAYLDAASDTTVWPTAMVGGAGLGGAMAGNAIVGGVTRTAPVPGYVDYLDAVGNVCNGTVCPNNAAVFYQRQWMIQTNAAGNLKTITVVAWDLTRSATQGQMPSTTLVSMKSQI